MLEDWERKMTIIGAKRPKLGFKVPKKIKHRPRRDQTSKSVEPLALSSLTDAHARERVG